MDEKRGNRVPVDRQQAACNLLLVIRVKIWIVFASWLGKGTMVSSSFFV